MVEETKKYKYSIAAFHTTFTAILRSADALWLPFFSASLGVLNTSSKKLNILETVWKHNMKFSCYR